MKTCGPVHRPEEKFLFSALARIHAGRLNCQAMSHWLLILNGNAAGRGDVRDAVLVSRERGVRLDVRVTWERGDAARYVAEAISTGARSIIAAGGDGTLNEVCAALADRPEPAEALPAVGVLPLGTANDFATAAGLPFEPQAALESIAHTAPQPIDLLRVQAAGATHWSVNVATGGFGTRITVETEPALKKLLGKVAYLLTGLTRFDSVKPAWGRLHGPNFDWQGDFLVLALGNARLAGGGQPLAPEARVDDGLLDLTLLPPPAEGELGAAIGALLTQGKQALLDAALRTRLPWLDIHCPDGLMLNLDGEPVEACDFRVDVVPGRLRMHLGSGSALLEREAREA
jgi:lipid kinase YegS